MCLLIVQWCILGIANGDLHISNLLLHEQDPILKSLYCFALLENRDHHHQTMTQL